jgi:hypothetical protein
MGQFCFDRSEINMVSNKGREMRRSALAFSILAILAWSAPAQAQDVAEEIVVTGSRYEDEYEDFKVPHVSILRRAVGITTTLSITSDTRDGELRRDEVRAALREVERRARGGAVTLAIVDDDVVLPFSLSAAEASIRGANRPDTSQVTLILRTAIAAGDTMDSAMSRFERFEDSLPRNGRIEYGIDTDPELTLINPGQYRAAIIAAISADVSAVTRSLGAGYAARIEGLEQQIAWRRTGDLELRLFIPYRLEIRPAGLAN